MPPLIVTLFVGHMSGVNWAPAWATGGSDGDRRFRVVVPGGEAPATGLRNWYSDPGIGAAQERLARASPDTGAGRLVDEETAAAYTARALDGLRQAGCGGALLWCFADYAATLHRRPPFDEARHERSFGLWRSDGSAKPAVAEITRRAGARWRSPPAERAWLDIGAEESLADRTGQLTRLYRRYCEDSIYSNTGSGSDQ